MQLSDSTILLWSAHWITRGTCNPSAGNAHPVCLLTYRIMSGSGYTVEVTNLSSSASENDLHEFFSFSGPIEHIDLIRWHFFAIHKLQSVNYMSCQKSCWASFKIHHAYWTFGPRTIFLFSVHFQSTTVTWLDNSTFVLFPCLVLLIIHFLTNLTLTDQEDMAQLLMWLSRNPMPWKLQYCWV